MRTATELRVPVVPQGARTGLSGAANASDGCIVLSLVKMDRILEINPVDRIAVVEPGVVNATLSRAVGEHGLYYPPDPSSWETCTIGGNIGTASGGLCCVKYGVTAEYVLGLDVVLADGRLLTTGRRTAKGVAGLRPDPALRRLRGQPRHRRPGRPRPEARSRPSSWSLAAEFASAAAACDAVCRIMEGGHVPSLLELMDRTTVKAVNDMANMGLPETTEALLLAAFDTPDPAADLAAVGALCEAAGATQVVPAEDAAESELLLQARRLSLTALEAVKGTTMIDDVCVPRSRLARDARRRRPRSPRSTSLTIGVCAHAGDGNTHPTVCFDAADPDESRRARESFDEIMALGLELGGTITGEHGVGVLKKEWLARETRPGGRGDAARHQGGLRPAGPPEPGQAVLTRAWGARRAAPALRRLTPRPCDSSRRPRVAQPQVVGRGRGEQLGQAVVDAEPLGLGARRDHPQGPLQPGGHRRRRGLQERVAVGRAQRHQDDAAAVDLRRPDPHVAVPARPEHPLHQEFAGERPVHRVVGADVEGDVDGVRVVGAVGEPGRDGDAALGRQDQFELQLAFHHGVHVGAFLSLLRGPAERARTRREREAAGALRDFAESFFAEVRASRCVDARGSVPGKGSEPRDRPVGCGGLIDVEPQTDPRADTGRRT